MPDMKELLPCPFCGGKANIENEGTQADITCEDCYASNNIQICDHFTYEERHNDPDFKWLDTPIYGYAHKGKQRAIDTLTKYWNTRTASKQLTETQQALEEANADIAANEVSYKEWIAKHDLMFNQLRIVKEALASIIGYNGAFGYLKNHLSMGDVLLFKGCRLDVCMALPEHQQTIIDAIDVLAKAKATLDSVDKEGL